MWLTGARTGSSDVRAEDLWGYPDNMALGSDGLIWVAVASPRVPSLDAILRRPPAVRALVRRLPQRLQPAPVPTVGVVALDPAGNVVRERTGTPHGGTLTGGAEAHGALWFGSVTGDSVLTIAVASIAVASIAVVSIAGVSITVDSLAPSGQAAGETP